MLATNTDSARFADLEAKLEARIAELEARATAAEAREKAAAARFADLDLKIDRNQQEFRSDVGELKYYCAEHSRFRETVEPMLRWWFAVRETLMRMVPPAHVLPYHPDCAPGRHAVLTQVCRDLQGEQEVMQAARYPTATELRERAPQVAPGLTLLTLRGLFGDRLGL